MPQETDENKNDHEALIAAEKDGDILEFVESGFFFLFSFNFLVSSKSARFCLVISQLSAFIDFYLFL